MVYLSIYLFIYLFIYLAALFFVVVHRFLIAVASLVAEHGL